MTSARHTSLFAAVAGALLPALFPPEPRAESVADPIHRMAYIALRSGLLIIPLFTSIIGLVNGDGLVLRYPSVTCPQQAVAYLQRENIRGNLLVPFNYGSYVMWELRGQMRVSMDGRYDLVYRPETYRRVENFFYGKKNWQSLLTTPAPQAILVPRTDSVYPKLRGEPGWKEVYDDSTDAIFLPR